MARGKTAVPPAWPADKIERRALASLKPHASNARTHSAEQISQLAASIKQWGWTIPILVDEDGLIIAGHGRYQAALQLGYSDAPVMTAIGWTAEQKRAYMLADNRLALSSGWDKDMLRLELGELKAVGMDLTLTGFSNDEMRDIVFPVPKGQKSSARGIKDGLSYQVVIDCADETQQAELLEELKGRKLTCRPLIL